ncbi:hypothetical protein Lepto7375DRAFT_1131 [Leptolyngbya sp. PCC 7375]|nr:hypothetical protein Lepto7375DRAFT_1131 [Leptolyngbya sp. PCC 7375]
MKLIYTVPAVLTVSLLSGKTVSPASANLSSQKVPFKDRSQKPDNQ